MKLWDKLKMFAEAGIIHRPKDYYLVYNNVVSSTSNVTSIHRN